ncbi:MAG: hypothetical protein ACREE3_07180, partial [Stellaceae bacterium]
MRPRVAIAIAAEERKRGTGNSSMTRPDDRAARIVVEFAEDGKRRLRTQSALAAPGIAKVPWPAPRHHQH